jgi:phosphoribosylaminoimidazolecarboxamide formyltransferase/IMP cyclohydrolase
MEEAIEQIDIGGVCLIRAAAKNWADLILVTSPEDYDAVLEELRDNEGIVGDSRRLELARKGFEHTAAYDTAICAYLQKAVKQDG